MRTLTKVGLVVLLSTLPYLALASNNQDHFEIGRAVDFIGVFHPVPTGLFADPARCPDASHPIVITFQGEAFTTLGHATFEQSHCEAVDHTSFRRGEQKITFDDGTMLFGTYEGLLFATQTTTTDR